MKNLLSNHPCKLLLIDPHPGDSSLASKILTQALEGCQVYVATDAISYAKYFSDGDFTAVISELELGWSSGVEILASFGQHHPDARLILFTRRLPRNIERLSTKLGLAGYAKKAAPVSCVCRI